MLDMTVNAEVAKVLGALDGALSSGDIDRAVSLFQTDCYWRDLVTFTWNIRTMEGHDQIRDMLTAQLGTVSGAAEVLEENPLPWVLLVSPEEAGDAGRLDRRVDLLLQELLGLEAVASAQYDRKWLERLARLLELGGAVALVLTILFGLAVTVVVANTIRLDVAARADEIEILALVGAGNSFIRQPFLYSGLWYGVLGGLLTLILLAASLGYLGAPLGRLLQTYGQDFSLQSLDLPQMLALLAASGLLGMGGAWVSVQRYLKILRVGGRLGRH